MRLNSTMEEDRGTWHVKRELKGRTRTRTRTLTLTLTLTLAALRVVHLRREYEEDGAHRRRT